MFVVELGKTELHYEAIGTMGETTAKEMRKTGTALVRAIKAGAPRSTKQSGRSVSSVKYGRIKSGKTRYAPKVKRTRNPGGRWQAMVVRAAIQVPYYGHFLNRGWVHAKSGRRIPGTHFIDDPIKRKVVR